MRFLFFIGIIIFMVFHCVLYSQINITYKDFINTYLNNSGMYQNVQKETLDILTSNPQMNKLFDDGIKSFTFNEIMGIIRNPEAMLDTTTNESVILLFGTTLAYLEIADAQVETSKYIMNALQRKAAFNTASGNNNGILIPMHTPIGSFDINFYTDAPLMQLDYIINKPANQTDYESISKAIEMLPIPHINAYFQINFGPVPLALTLRGGMSFGFKELYGAAVNDVEIESLGWNIGASLKAYLFRTKYFFGDIRTDFNYDATVLNLAANNRYIYVPLRLGFLGGTDTGVVFNGNAFIKSKWQTFTVSPKVVFGFKFKEEVKYIKYFSAYAALSADIAFGNVDFNMGINGMGSYANIVGNSITVNELYIPHTSAASKYVLCDIRLSLGVDIFYQSLSFEFGFLTKQFGISLIPINIRF